MASKHPDIIEVLFCVVFYPQVAMCYKMCYNQPLSTNRERMFEITHRDKDGLFLEAIVHADTIERAIEIFRGSYPEADIYSVRKSSLEVIS